MLPENFQIYNSIVALNPVKTDFDRFSDITFLNWKIAFMSLTKEVGVTDLKEISG